MSLFFHYFREGHEASSHLKQLVHFELLGTEHDAVTVPSDPDGLATVAEQHHVLPVFAVQPVGHARNYTHTEDIFRLVNDGGGGGDVELCSPGEWMGKLFSVMLLLQRLLSNGPEELVMDTWTHWPYKSITAYTSETHTG